MKDTAAGGKDAKALKLHRYALVGNLGRGLIIKIWVLGEGVRKILLNKYVVLEMRVNQNLLAEGGSLIFGS